MMVCGLLYILKYYFICHILHVIKMDLTIKADFPYYTKYCSCYQIQITVEYILYIIFKSTSKRLRKTISQCTMTTYVNVIGYGIS